MKAQGVNLMASSVSEIKVTKKTTNQSTEAQSQTFDNFITNNAKAAKVEKVSTGTDASSQIQTSKKSEDGSSSNKTRNTDTDQNNVKKADAKDTRANDSVSDPKVKKPESVAKADGAKGPEAQDDVDVEQLNEDVLEILQSVLGLSEQDLNDLFAMVDMEPKDLFLGIQSGEIESFSITTVQTFVMEVHGITDTSAFLTNDDLMQEVNDIFDRMKELMADLMGVTLDQDGNIDDGVWDKFVSKLVAPVEEQRGEQIPTEPIGEMEVAADDASSGMQVIIENRNDSSNSGTGEQTGQRSGLGSDELDRTASDVERMAGNTSGENVRSFTENLTDAVAESTQIDAARTDVTEMVEQVVRQVRLRVMPETTNMELMLHPASLGRVSVQINATAEAASARLIVESQSAKEALESGMIRLQEAFEEKGIKVEAVEITVSNFDVATRQNGGDQGEASEGGRRNRRRSEGGSSDTVETEGTSERLTEASRVDANSTVDYTA